MKKIILLFVCMILLSSCKKQEITIVVETNNFENLPVKGIQSNKMSDSPITPKEIDDYMFRDDCVYIDTRSPSQFLEEGHIDGFVNIPFYELICDFKEDSETLFYFKKVDKDILLGDVGSFFEKYEESIDTIYSLFPKDKNILVISTAGVESCYLLNLLEQLGYDDSKLYNVGSFTTGMGKDIAYLDYQFAKYLVEPTYLDEYKVDFNFNNLNKK